MRTQNYQHGFRQGFCTIGDRESYSGSWPSIAGGSLSATLRVGVGDSSSASGDSEDWTLFMVYTLNGGGDYKGNKVMLR